MAESCTAARPDLTGTESGTGLVADRDRNDAARTWLAEEFPAWDIAVDTTAGWDGVARDLWVASRDGHHPQRELTAAKLHTRLDEYEERERRRVAFASDN